MADAKVCPHCGAKNAADTRACWLCNHDFAPVARVNGGTGAAPARKQFAHAPDRTAYSFSLSTLLLVITLIAVVFGMLAVAPGLGIVLAIFSLPVLARTAGVVRAREAIGLPTPPARRALLFASSLLTAIVVAAVVGIASIGTFCGVCVGISIAKGKAGFPGFQDDAEVLIAFIVAAVPTIGVIIVAFKWIRGRWRRDTREP